MSDLDWDEIEWMEEKTEGYLGDAGDHLQRWDRRLSHQVSQTIT
jgi:hypothetical protein